MKKSTFLLCIFLLVTTNFLFAQVGIGTKTPNNSSMLDIESTDKGILIPRMTEAQKISVSSPATGLLIYQIDKEAGFYFYDGSIWLRLVENISPNFTGTITSGSISATGTISATYIVGDGSGLTGINLNTVSITTNINDIAANTASINTNQGLIASNTSSIASNQGAITTNTANISTNQILIASNTSSITTNQVAIAANTASNTTNQGAITTNTSSITSNINKIATNTASITTNQGVITANTASITSNINKITTNTASITTNQGVITANTASITSNINKIATNTASINTNTASITTNQGVITANTASITSNINDIALKANKANPTFTGTITSGSISATGTISATYIVGDGSKLINLPSSGGGLQSITEGVNTGYRRADAIAANYGDIGLGAVDLSFSESPSSTLGATGDYSTAMGFKTKASGNNSTAMGDESVASGNGSTAMGLTIASGDYSTAMGWDNNAIGKSSTAIGTQNTANGDSSLAIGFNTTANGPYSTAMGSETLADGFNSTAMGAATRAIGSFSTAMGFLTTSSDYGSLIIGSFNNAGSSISSGGNATSFTLSNTAFVIGNGKYPSSRSDAFKVMFNGDTTAAGTISATAFVGDGSGLTNLPFSSDLTGEVSLVGNSITLSNTAVIEKTLTGFTSGAGQISASDNILQAIQKADGNLATAIIEVNSGFTNVEASLTALNVNKASLASPIFTGTITSDSITSDSITSGTISSTGEIKAVFFVGDGSRLTDLPSVTDESITSDKILNGTILNTDISSAAAIDQSKISGLTDALFNKVDKEAGGRLIKQAEINQLLNLSQDNSGIISNTLNIGTLTNLTTTNQTDLVSAINEIEGTLNSKAPLASPNFTGTITSGSISATGTISATYFVGDGSKLTNLPSSGGGLQSFTSSINDSRTGYRRADNNSYDDIGSGAIDLSKASDGAFGAIGEKSTAMGFSTTASGTNSTAMGVYTTASGEGSTAMGKGTTASDFGSLIIGTYNNAGSSISSGGNATSFTLSNTAFVIGNGIDPSSRSDAFKVMFNGDTTAAGTISATAFVGDGSGLTNVGMSSSTLKDAYSNVVVGSTLESLTPGGEDGSYNLAIGDGTLLKNTIGSWNIALGYKALANNTEGDDNTAIGDDALGSITTGDVNIGIGYNALGSSEYGESNIAIGYNTLSSASDTDSSEIISNNTVIGQYALEYLETINETVGLGTSLGGNLVKDDALFGVTLIGSSATTVNGEISNSTALGYRATVTLSNTIQLGNSDVNLVNTSATVSAAAFVGDGSRLTGLPSGGGLQSIIEEGNTGYRRSDATAEVYGDIGQWAVDLSISDTSSSTGATGIASVAMGYNTSATSSITTAFGNSTTASGNNSTAMGNSTTASGDSSTAMGDITKAIGSASTAMGFRNIASGEGSTAMGYSTYASGVASTAMGFTTTASDFGSLIIGSYNNAGFSISSDGNATSFTLSNTAFVIGNGEDNESRSDAFKVMFNGDTTAAGTISATAFVGDGSKLTNLPSAGGGLLSIIEEGNTGYRRSDANAANYGDIGEGAVDLSFSGSPSSILGATGLYSTAMGLDATASGDYSTAMGKTTTASKYAATAMGVETIASGSVATSMGISTIASGAVSTAMGYFSTASGDYSTAIGGNTTASGDYSTAMGVGTSALSFRETAIGSFNTTYTPTSITGWDAADRLFVIGNGQSSGPPSDALVMLKNGNTTFSGTITANAFVGDGSGLTGINLNTVSITTNINDIAANTASITTNQGVITANTASITSNINDIALKANTADPTFTGTITSGSISATGTISATEFVGDGSKLTNLPSGAGGLQSITEGVNTGYRRADAIAANYGDIGLGAVDLSYSGTSGNFGATGNYSTAMGYKTIASGLNSTAMGDSNTASGNNSTAMGYKAKASGVSSTAMGDTTKASGSASTAMGGFSSANGSYSTAMGFFTNTSDFGSLVIGQYNSAGSSVSTNGSATTFDTDNTAFVIGNGTSSLKSDAFKVMFNGDVTTGGTVKATRFELTAATEINSSSNTTLDLSSGNVLTVSLVTSIEVLTITNAVVGTYLIKFVQDGTGQKTVDFSSTNWKWSGGTAPYVTNTANRTDIVTLIYDGEIYYAAISQNF